MKEKATIAKIQEALSDWEEVITWIAKGWDCIDEYDHDLFYRETLEGILNSYIQTQPLPKHLVERLAAADNQFKSVTEPSNLCIWGRAPSSQKYQDKDKYWYYYRWQPDCPYLRVIR